MPRRVDPDLEYAIRAGILNNKRALKELFLRQANFLADEHLLPGIRERGRAIFANAIEVDVPRATSNRGEPVVRVLQNVLTQIGALFVENSLRINHQRIADAAALEQQSKDQKERTIPPESVHGVTTESADSSNSDPEMSSTNATIEAQRKRNIRTHGTSDKAPKIARRESTEEVEAPMQFPAKSAGSKHGSDTIPSQTSSASHDSAKRSRIVKLLVPKRFQSVNTMPPRRGRPLGSSNTNKVYKSAEFVASPDTDEESQDGNDLQVPRRDTPTDNTPTKEISLSKDAPAKNTTSKNKPIRRSSRVSHKQSHKPASPPKSKLSSRKPLIAPTPFRSEQSPTPFPFPPFPPLAPRDLTHFYNGALIALDNIREGHTKDATLSLPELVQDLEDNAPTPAKGERKSAFKTVLYGGEWVYESLRSVWEDREGAEEEGGNEKGKETKGEREGEGEFTERAVGELVEYMEREHGRMARRA